MKAGRRRARGVAAVALVLLILVVVALAARVALGRAGQAVADAADLRDSAQALFAAESGGERVSQALTGSAASAALACDCKAFGGTTSPDCATAGGTVNAAYSLGGGAAFTLVSLLATTSAQGSVLCQADIRGTSGRASRTLSLGFGITGLGSSAAYGTAPTTTSQVTTANTRLLNVVAYRVGEVGVSSNIALACSDASMCETTLWNNSAGSGQSGVGGLGSVSAPLAVGQYGITMQLTSNQSAERYWAMSSIRLQPVSGVPTVTLVGTVVRTGSGTSQYPSGGAGVSLASGTVLLFGVSLRDPTNNPAMGLTSISTQYRQGGNWVAAASQPELVTSANGLEYNNRVEVWKVQLTDSSTRDYRFTFNVSSSNMNMYVGLLQVDNVSSSSVVPNPLVGVGLRNWREL